MAGGGRLRKRVKAETETPSSPSASSAAGGIKRARDGSGFTKCEECNKHVAVALISFHDCSLEAKIKMNLEAQVMETPNEAKKKKPATEKRNGEPKAKKVKKAKDPNAPKRPPTPFFVFMDEFRKSFKEANPDCKSVATVAKEGGEKWKSMTAEEKKPYVEKAAELKAEYEKALESKNPDNDEGDATENEAKEDETEEPVNEVKEEEIEDDE